MSDLDLLNDSLGLGKPASIAERIAEFVAPEWTEPEESKTQLIQKNPFGSPNHMREMLGRWQYFNERDKAYRGRLNFITEEYEKATGTLVGVEKTPEYLENKALIEADKEGYEEFVRRNAGLRHYDKDFAAAATELYGTDVRGPSDRTRLQRLPPSHSSYPGDEILYDKSGWGADFPDMTTEQRLWRDKVSGTESSAPSGTAAPSESQPESQPESQRDRRSLRGISRD